MWNQSNNEFFMVVNNANRSILVRFEEDDCIPTTKEKKGSVNVIVSPVENGGFTTVTIPLQSHKVFDIDVLKSAVEEAVKSIEGDIPTKCAPKQHLYKQTNFEFFKNIGGTVRSVVVDFEWCMHAYDCYMDGTPHPKNVIPVEVYPSGSGECTFEYNNPLYTVNMDELSRIMDDVVLKHDTDYPPYKDEDLDF